MTKIRNHSDVLEQDQITLDNLEQANKTGMLTDQQQNIQDKIVKIEQVLPTQVRIPEIFLKILYIADSIDLEQESITMQNTIIEEGEGVENQPSDEDAVDENEFQEENMQQQASNEKLLVIPIQHNFRGSYAKIKKYMEEIQNCERKIDIIQYQLSADDYGSDNKKDQLSANFLLHSYALVKDAQNYSEFVDYDFIKESYGRNNPFDQGAFTVIEDDIE